MRYLVLLLRTEHFQPEFIAAHQTFLAELRSSGCLQLAGPFTDQSGGAYLLDCVDVNTAHAIAYRDPLHTSGSSHVTIYEWQTQP